MAQSSQQHAEDVARQAGKREPSKKLTPLRALKPFLSPYKGMIAAASLALLAAALAGVFGNLIQHGFIWTADKLKPDFSRVSPGKAFGRIFGLDGWAQFAPACGRQFPVAPVDATTGTT